MALIIGVSFLAREAKWGFYRAAYPTHYSEYVERYSALNNLPPSLVYAVIRTESGFRTDAYSFAGAKGLMQITEDTFHWIIFREGKSEYMHFDILYDPETNIRFGTALLRMHLDEFGSVRNAMSAYHAGRGSLQSWLANPEFSANGIEIDYIPFNTTRWYVDRVIETAETYRLLYGID